MSDRPTEARPILILGPTAGGKSDLAVELAERLPEGGEVIGADSMQVYQHMDAGTAKPDHTLRGRAPHHLIDIAMPTERFTVHDWLTRAEQAIAAITARGRRPIVVGGTNLYMKALLEGLFDGPAIDRAFRAEMDQIDPAELHARLAEVDPPAAARIHPNDRKRLTRALEVFHLTGQPISQQQTQWDGGGDEPAPPHPPFQLVGLAWETPEINRRINLRVKAMFYPEKVEPQLAQAVCIGGESLPAETERLWEAGLLGEQAREALGYKQVLAAMGAEGMHDRLITSMDDAFERTKILTRRFAKQQRTWLKRFRDVQWISAATPRETWATQAIEVIG